jgi:hypothetical protein
MTLLEAFIKLSGAKASLEPILRAAPEDLRPAAQEWLARLQNEVTPEGLAGVVKALPAEAQDIFRGHLAPEDHPGDFA